MNSDSFSWNDVNAHWVCLDGVQDVNNLLLDFARPFETDGTSPLTLRISAVSDYQVHVNGRLLARGPAVGSQQLYYYHTHAVPADMLRSGTNLLAVVFFHDGRNTKTVQGFQYGDPGLIAHLSGPGVDVVTDTSWRVRRSPARSPMASLVSNWGSYKEYYHGEREDGWLSPDYDHGAWERAIEVAPPESPSFVRRLVPLDVPELEWSVKTPARVVNLASNLGSIAMDDAEGEDLPAPYRGSPIVVESGEPGAAPSVTLDFGAMVVGYPDISVSGGGCVFEVWYGETFEMWRLDVVRLPAGGAWRAFHRRAFRYMKLVFIAVEDTATVESVRHHNAWYDYDDRGALATSDRLVNRVMDVSRRTLLANTSYHYEDCPMRERALWVMDMRIMGSINAYLYGNHELTAKCLRQMCAIQRDDGSIAATGPKDNDMFAHDFLFHLVATIKEHYQHTGDMALLEELYPRLAPLHRYILNCRADDGLLDTDLFNRAAPFLDWSASIEKLGKTTILNALYKLYLEDMAALARFAGDGGAAGDYAAESERVAARTHELLFSDQEGLYRDAWRQGGLRPAISQQANMAAIMAGIPPKDAIPGIMRKVWDSDAYPRPFGPSYYLIVFEALARIGRYDAMMDVIREYWGAMLRRGATTWWEVFDPSTPGWAYPHTFLGNVPTFEMDWIPISACHGWSGTPAYAIPRHILGIDLSRLYQNKVTVKPGLPGLFEHVTYALPLQAGMLRLEFTRREDEYRIKVLDEPRGIDLVY